MAEQSKIVCKKCGGDNVQTLMWVNANTNKALDHYASGWDKVDANWCEGCDDHVELVHLNNHQALLMKLISEAGVQGDDALACVTIAKDHNIL